MTVPVEENNNKKTQQQQQSRCLKHIRRVSDVRARQARTARMSEASPHGTNAMRDCTFSHNTRDGQLHHLTGAPHATNRARETSPLLRSVHKSRQSRATPATRAAAKHT
jgi:hypothetical protein